MGQRRSQIKVITNSHVKVCRMHLGRTPLASANSWNPDNTPPSSSSSRLAGSTLTPGSSRVSSSASGTLSDSAVSSYSVAVPGDVSKSPVPSCQKDLSRSCSADPKPTFLFQSFEPHPASGSGSVYTNCPFGDLTSYLSSVFFSAEEIACHLLPLSRVM